MRYGLTIQAWMPNASPRAIAMMMSNSMIELVVDFERPRPALTPACNLKNDLPGEPGRSTSPDPVFALDPASSDAAPERLRRLSARLAIGATLSKARKARLILSEPDPGDLPAY